MYKKNSPLNELEWVVPTLLEVSATPHKTNVERRQTLGHPRYINPNMINHVPQQSPLIF